jgi:hypothetical protein
VATNVFPRASALYERGLNVLSFRWKECRFFFSREEERMQVHVGCPDGEAK